MPRRASAITLNNSGILFNGIQYAFDQISSLEFFYSVIHTRLNFQDVGDNHQAYFNIFIEGRTKPIKIESGGGWFLITIDRTEKRAHSVVELYRELAKVTFRSRLQRYLDMINRTGYFFYDGKKIYTDGRVIDGPRQLNLKTDRPLYKKPFFIYHLTPKSTFEKLKHLFASQDFIIRTRCDSDVFFALLRHLFQIEWE